MAHPTMEHPAFSLAQHVAAEKAQPAAPGTQIGPYVLGELLGEGSFAHVYRAEQQRPLRRQVAVKVLKTGMDSKAVVARFEQERQTLARFSHPHIATVIDAGMDATGRPYFVMEYVAGTPLTTFCNRHPVHAGLQRSAVFALAGRHSPRPQACQHHGQRSAARGTRQGH